MKYDYRKQLRSFVFAWKGIYSCLGHEQNLSFHLLAAILTLATGYFFEISLIEWTIIVLCIGLVIAAELINTAIERLVDLVSPQRNPLAGQVKDIAAGAVLVCALAAAITGIIIFLPYFIGFIRTL